MEKTGNPVVPNQTLSIQEILLKYGGGQDLPHKADPYFTEEDLSQFDHLSRIEKQEALHANAELIRSLQNELQQLQGKTPPPLKTKKARQNPT